MKTDKFKLIRFKVPGLSVMDRYIIAELTPPFLFGMGLFTSLGLSIGALFYLVRKISESNLSLSTALQILFLKMPEFVVLAFPMSVLLATLMAYSRLSSDSEIIALRSSGIRIYRLLLPAIALSLLIVSLTFLGKDFIAPASNYQASITLDRALKRVKPSYVDKNIIYPEYEKVAQDNNKKQTVLNRLFYAAEFDGQYMKGLTILDRSQKGINRIITADRAIWNVDLKNWHFYKGTVYTIASNGTYSNIDRFEEQTLKLSKAPLELAKRGLHYDQMNILQAIDYLNVVRLSGDRQKIRQLQVKIQEKIAFPFVCLIFALVGAAIGLKPQNTGKVTSFGICIILIFSYHLLSFLSISMGVWGIVSPFVAAWLPNFLGLGVGFWLSSDSSK